MDKKPYTPPTFSPIPLPDSPLPLMVSGFKVDNIHTGGVRDQGEDEEVEADSKENPWHTNSHFGMMMPTLDNTTTGENSTSRFPRISFYDGNHLYSHKYYSSHVSRVFDMLTVNKLICRQVDSPSKKTTA